MGNQYGKEFVQCVAIRMNRILVSQKIVWNSYDTNERLRVQGLEERGYETKMEEKALDFEVQLKLFCG